MIEIVENLQRLRTLFEKPGSWTKGTMARNAKGEKCPIQVGVCWCLVGGMSYVIPDEQGYANVEDEGYPKAFRELRNALAEAMGDGESLTPSVFGDKTDDLIYWNDITSRTQKDILELIDKAIARQKS